jgi:hypothetical protein
MKKYILGLLLCGLYGSIFAQSNARIANTGAVNKHTITLPMERAVYQRVGDQATIRLAGQLRTIKLINRVEYRVRKLDKFGNVVSTQIDWTILPLFSTVNSGGLFNTTVTLPTGWYDTQVRTRFSLNNTYEESDPVKFGIGEVLFFAGQSNAQGVPLQSEGYAPAFSNTYDCISAVSQNCWCKKTYEFPLFTLLKRELSDGIARVAPNGNQNVWCYEALGRKLVEKAESQEGKIVPIVVFNAGSTSTAINNWKESAENAQAQTMPLVF